MARVMGRDMARVMGAGHGTCDGGRWDMARVMGAGHGTCDGGRWGMARVMGGGGTWHV